MTAVAAWTRSRRRKRQNIMMQIATLKVIGHEKAAMTKQQH
jgi:hypothetical protein